jgi:hypothetical protein
MYECLRVTTAGLRWVEHSVERGVGYTVHCVSIWRRPRGMFSFLMYMEYFPDSSYLYMGSPSPSDEFMLRPRYNVLDPGE